MDAAKQDAILTFVSRNLAGDSPAGIDADTSLFAARVLDSMCLMELVAFVEDRFGVKVRPVDLVFENFDTVANLVRYIERQR